MKIFLLIGQSNMAGPSCTRWDEEDDDRLEGVFLLNAEDKWEKAKNPLNAYSTVKWQPYPGLSPGVTFAQTLKAAYPNESIGLISNARGASKIAEWQKGERYFEEAVRRAKAACGEDRLAGILWLQGEQDTPLPADYGNYDEKLRRFIFDIREALGGQDIPFIACEIWGGNVAIAPEEARTGIKEVNRQIASVIAETEYCAMTQSAGLTHTKGDEVHFDAPAMRILGRRFAETYLHTFAK